VTKFWQDVLNVEGEGRIFSSPGDGIYAYRGYCIDPPSALIIKGSAFRPQNVFAFHVILAIKGKVKLSLYQAVEAHRVVRRQGSHIF
jgi:hypothetical protein